jgi:nitrile hydratase accessory protein
MTGLLRRRDGEPVFAEAWQAQLMALANGLIERRIFTAEAFSKALGDELKRSAAAGQPDDSASYYDCVLRVLERMSVGEGLVGARELAATRQAWEEAYETTPHGMPVHLPGGKAR